MMNLMVRCDKQSNTWWWGEHYLTIIGFDITTTRRTTTLERMYPHPTDIQFLRIF